ncbi:hypothetical protein NEUTE1DRAFT_115803 [Neurospora tetrasperma FGSC 2508]|uniref:Uncharacterized protein n=1 Tax=Neurospora tetrasperma (strain FGSC 2508 / ATCC MYA-4615 / P0657) TaxID=510951 RepID=F8MDC4_NEUT8|nr:uncharacterized protein NEUTE1DRAFT_115803 [Neurospora tetrasperma FGSC 2508]EGO60616.1 hypothetical protein NEUTE1DRAFT_115803 [Neurospora tetrasperma FGSC 2508]EGZ75403.1 hypothetical protein NEUTE2DRAFT_143677 [Neurospora tetrasperma FGSC 2509]
MLHPKHFLIPFTIYARRITPNPRGLSNPAPEAGKAQGDRKLYVKLDARWSFRRSSNRGWSVRGR